MSFLYFIPKLQTVDRAAIDSLGLAGVIDKPEVGIVHANGPDGGPGVVICDRSAGNPPRIVLTQQTWRAAPKRGAEHAPYWIGYWNDRVPSEANLRRAKGLPGDSIELRDGGLWTVPKLVQFDSTPSDRPITYAVALPQVLDVNDDGDLVAGRIDAKYQSLWDTGWAAHESLSGQAMETGRAVLTELDARRFACDLLAVNYRIGALEIATLGLFDNETSVKVVCSAIDSDTFWDAVKNRVGRSEVATTDSLSGAERPQMESTTDILTGHP